MIITVSIIWFQHIYCHLFHIPTFGCRKFLLPLFKRKIGCIKVLRNEFLYIPGFFRIQNLHNLIYFGSKPTIPIFTITKWILSVARVYHKKVWIQSQSILFRKFRLDICQFRNIREPTWLFARIGDKTVLFPDFVIASPKNLHQRVWRFSDALPSTLSECIHPCSEVA